MMDAELIATISLFGAMIAAATTVVAIYYRAKESRSFQKYLRLLLRMPAVEIGGMYLKHGPQEKFEQEYLKELAQVSPSAAVIASWHEVERALNEKSSEERKYIEEEWPDIRNSIDELRFLRNKLLHDRFEIDKSTAFKLAELTSKIIQDIRDTGSSPNEHLKPTS